MARKTYEAFYEKRDLLKSHFYSPPLPCSERSLFVSLIACDRDETLKEVLFGARLANRDYNILVHSSTGVAIDPTMH